MVKLMAGYEEFIDMMSKHGKSAVIEDVIEHDDEALFSLRFEDGHSHLFSIYVGGDVRLYVDLMTVEKTTNIECIDGKACIDCIDRKACLVDLGFPCAAILVMEPMVVYDGENQGIGD